MSNKGLISLDEYREAVAKHLLEKIFKLLLTEEQKYGNVFVLKVVDKLVTGIIGGMLYRELTMTPPLLEKEEQYEFTKAAFSKYKSGVQEAVALAFQGAMTQWSGKSVEYYCQVKPVPEPTNKYEC
jgi:hypothetical protein